MKFIKELMKSLPVKSLVLLPVFFMFVLTLGGCASSSSIVIRNVPDSVWNTLNENCWNYDRIWETECELAVIEALPAITANSVPLIGELGYWAEGDFYATFNTGRAPIGAITWTLTINNVPVTDDHPNAGILYDLMGNVEVWYDGQFPAQEVRLTANADGASSRSIVLTAPPASEGGGSTPEPDETERGSQRH